MKFFLSVAAAAGAISLVVLAIRSALNTINELEAEMCIRTASEQPEKMTPSEETM